MNNPKANNPLLHPFVGKYQAPPFDLIHEGDYIPAIEILIRQAEEKIEQIVNCQEDATFNNTILPLEQNGEHLGIVAGILFNLNHAETSEKLQQVAQEASQMLTEYSNRMLMNPALFRRIDNLYKNRQPTTDNRQPTTDNLSSEQLTVLGNWHRDFVRNGASLEEEAKKRFSEIRSRLSVLTLQFADNVLAETNTFFLHLTDDADLSGLPDFVKEAASQEAGSRKVDGWVLTLHAPGYVPFLKYSDRRDLREKMARAFGARGNQDNEHDNKALMREIVNLRMEQASMMKEPDYASYMLKESMAKSTAKVLTFLDDIHRFSKPAVQHELDEVVGFARSQGVDFELESWDWSYYAEKLRQKKFNFREELLKPYFKLENVIHGIFLLADKLYGLQFEAVEGIPVYHPDVKTYEVKDENGEFLSLLYLDFFPRQGKQGGAWMTDFRGQSNLNGLIIRPQVSLVCNFSKPSSTKPSLLTFDEVTTFLHEFGHALHGMLSRCTYPSVSGTNVYRDFVELPSQMMENWALEKDWLDLFAVHFETGEKIPAELIDSLIESKNFLEGYAFERQLSFGFLDLAWHTLTEPFDGDPVAFEKQAMDDTQLFRKIPGSSVSTGFSHIFAGGYAAGYYGYKWAEVLDADAFAVFSQKGIFNREVAASFRKNILEKGGSEHPMVLYTRFRGQEPDPHALLKRSGLMAENG
jgi:peptidyl-dipeptidase Dcp